MWINGKVPAPDSPRSKTIRAGGAQRYDESKVVLSFGAGNGGALFAQWLRERIMALKGFTQPNDVYLDTIGLALPGIAGTNLVMLTRKDRPGAGGLASFNDSWNSYYVQAMNEAHTMIFVLTKDWWLSQNCSKELSQFRTENVARTKAGRPPLTAVALHFADFPGMPMSGMTLVPAERVYAVANEEKRLSLSGNMRDFWMIDDTTLGRVVSLIR